MGINQDYYNGIISYQEYAGCRDYYQIFEISPKTPSKELKRAYIKVSRIYHTDFHESESDENKKKYKEIMQKINEAKEVLLEPNKRREYDEIMKERELQAQREQERQAAAQQQAWYTAAAQEKARTETAAPQPAPDKENQEAKAKRKDILNVVCSGIPMLVMAFLNATERDDFILTYFLFVPIVALVSVIPCRLLDRYLKEKKEKDFGRILKALSLLMATVLPFLIEGFLRRNLWLFMR